MITQLPQPKKKPAEVLPCHDFTVIDKDLDGNVVMEVNSWCEETQQHTTVTLCMYPEEAKMFASMMTKHADEAEELQASGTPQYGT